MEIGALIRRAARHYGDDICLAEGDRNISFREFDRMTDRLGVALLRRGLQPGDRVGVLLPNGVECLVAYYALAKAGLVRVALNSRDSLESHRYKLEDSGARGLISSGAPDLQSEVALDIEELKEICTQENDAACLIERALDDPFRLAYTGGTTGKPKAVTLTARGELSEVAAFLIDLMPNFKRGETFLHAAPIAHASGAFFLPALARGVRSVIMPKFEPKRFLETAADEGAHYTFLVPTMLAMILEEPGMDQISTRFTRIAYGASPISPALLARSEARFGRVFVQCYGQAESPMAITCLQPQDHDRIGSCGRPFSLVEVAIVDEDDRLLPPGEIGEVVVRGPQTMAYYWNRPAETNRVFRNGWLHTGDIGTMDRDGFFYLKDRKNDMIISGGFNVYPREVEEVLEALDGIIEAAVVGIPDEKWGERVHAVVTTRAPINLDVIHEYAKRRLAGYKCPKTIEVWPELPKSAANKILRRSVREQLIARLQVPASASAED